VGDLGLAHEGKGALIASNRLLEWVAALGDVGEPIPCVAAARFTRGDLAAEDPGLIEAPRPVVIESRTAPRAPVSPRRQPGATHLAADVARLA
jgi:hypothetical protein